MANTSELEKGLNELKRLTGITLAVTAEDSEQEQMALEHMISLAQTGVIPCLLAASGNTPIPSNRLPSVIVIPDSLPAWLFPENRKRLHRHSRC